MLRRSTISVLGLTVLLVLCSCREESKPPTPRANSNVSGQPALGNDQRRKPVANTGTAAWTLLDSRRMRIKDYEGQVVVLDFWATYCPPCVAEAPHLAELQRRYEKQGLTVIGLNVGGPDDQ